MSQAQARFDQLAARLDAALIELMAKAAYEAGRAPGSSRPAWEATTEAWQAMGKREIAGALIAAEAAGYTISKSGPVHE